jgi:hypothetical protein
MDDLRTLSRRDSCTSILRKMGINPRDYNLFITPTGDGKFQLNVGLAQSHLKGPTAEPKKATKMKPVTTMKRAKDEPAAKKAKDLPWEGAPKGMTVSQLARKLIKDGLTNSEIWAKLKEQFNLADNKRYYPAWYRAESRKQQGQA